jgi:hypothetical protein
LLLAAPAIAWVVWLALKTDVRLEAARRWTSLAIRLLVLLALLLALAGLQILQPIRQMNVFFLLDRSESVPSAQQEAARQFVNTSVKAKPKGDRAGVIVFGNDASIEFLPNPSVDLQKVQAVVGPERTDIAAALRLGAAALPEVGQKRLVLVSDGNENVGDALAAAQSIRNLGVTVDVLPLGINRRGDVSLQRIQIPARLKKGQPFEAKIFIESESARTATLRLYRNQEYLGEQSVSLSAGKNLFSFPQKLETAGFYSYDAQLEASNDPVPQNNRASGFTAVAGQPAILIVSANPEQDAPLAQALQSANLTVTLAGLNQFPGTLAELQTYDSIFISNLAAGDLGLERQRLLESVVRDFGVGLVCVGGDQTYAAGGYRGTPLENTLPVSMELDSRKVLPSGAVVLVI